MQNIMWLCKSTALNVFENDDSQASSGMHKQYTPYSRCRSLPFKPRFHE